jgi:hypothetical protein
VPRIPLLGYLDIALLDSPADCEIEGLTECFAVTQAKFARVGQPYWTGTRGPWTLSTVWQKIAGEVVIPYDLDQRKKKYPGAYSALRPRIEYLGIDECAGWACGRGAA